MSITKQFLMIISALALMLQPASAETISIGGSTTVQKYIKLAAVAYSSMHPEVNFGIHGGGSTAGFAQIVNKRTHIGMLSRELTAQEKQELGDTRQIAIALDAVVPIISREIYEAGVQQIKPETLAQIYRGQITNWKQLGGLNHRIIAVDKNIYHGTRAVFAGYLSSSSVLGASASESIVLNSDDDVMQLIKSSDQAIGYIGLGYLNQDVRELSLNIGGKTIKASLANIRSGAYPLSRNLYLLVPKNTPDYVQNFVQFILSPEGQRIVGRAGYLPLQ